MLFRSSVLCHEREEFLAILAVVALLLYNTAEYENQYEEAKHITFELLPLGRVYGALIIPLAAR